LDFILPQKFPAKAKKPPFGKEKFERVSGICSPKNAPDAYLPERVSF
jgi:hypothetical protein